MSSYYWQQGRPVLEAADSAQKSVEKIAHRLNLNKSRKNKHSNSLHPDVERNLANVYDELSRIVSWESEFHDKHVYGLGAKCLENEKLSMVEFYLLRAMGIITWGSTNSEYDHYLAEGIKFS